MSCLGTAVIGLGRMGYPYARVLSRLPTAKLVAVCDVDAERTRQVATEMRVPGYTDYREMLEREPAIQAVCVCTPDAQHRDPCEAAASRGKHILLEKPLSTTVADGEAIVACARRAGVKLMVAHILRFDPRYVRAWEAVRQGRLGEPIHAFVRRNNILNSGRRIGGRTSVLYFLGVHDIDFLLWCWQDQPTSVYAVSTRKLLTDLGVDDTIFALIRFAKGSVACVEVSWVLPNTSLAILDARLEIVGTQGAVYVDVNGQGFTLADEERVERADTVYGPVIHGEVQGALKDEIEHFVTCVLEDREPLIPGEEALKAIRVIEAAHRSLESGHPEEVQG